MADMSSIVDDKSAITKIILNGIICQLVLYLFRDDESQWKISSIRIYDIIYFQMVNIYICICFPDILF